MSLSEVGRYYKSDLDKIFVAASGKVKDEANISGGTIKFQELAGKELTQKLYKMIIREHRAYRLVVE